MIAVVTLALFTECESVAELPLKPASPEYLAVNVRAPAVNNDSMQLPAPALSGPEQELTPSETVTVPVGVPSPGGVAATVKPTSIGCPVTLGSGVSDVMVVVVPGRHPPRRSETFFEDEVAAAKSCMPPPLKSPIATEKGREPTVISGTPGDVNPPAPSPRRIA